MKLRKFLSSSELFKEVKPITKKPMTSILPKEKLNFKKFIKRFYNAFKVILTGRY